jgi:ABC-2 type transport system permease protein
MEPIKLYCKLVAIKVRGQMAYKVSFLLMSVGHFLVTFIEFLGIYALFLRFDQINGWSFYEVAVFYGFINGAFAIAEAFGRGYDTFHRHVKMGSFDRFLLRPRNISLQILSSELQVMRIGRFAQGLIVLIWGLTHVSTTITMGDILLLMYSLVCAVAFFLGLMVLQATLSFWSVESLEIMNAFTYGGVQTAQYPIDIYRDWFRKLFIYIIPMGSVSYFPILTILRGGNLLLGMFMPLMGIVFFAVGLIAFRFGIRHYCSTGS